MAANRRRKPRNTTTQPGYWAAKRALARFGNHVIDGRSRVCHALDAFRDQLLNDLGGKENTSQQQRVIVDLAVRTHLMVSSLDNYILNLDHLVHRKKKQLWPVVRERVALADSLSRYMAMLGLERRAKKVESLDDFLRRREQELSAAKTEGSGALERDVESAPSGPPHEVSETQS